MINEFRKRLARAQERFLWYWRYDRGEVFLFGGLLVTLIVFLTIIFVGLVW